MNITRRRRRAPRGFTLVELMVVIAIIGLLAAVVTVNVISQMDEARKTKVAADMQAIEDALKLFKVNMGYYPDSNQFNLLWEAPANGGSRWKGPYLEEYPPVDPWGAQYTYQYNGRGDFEITSYGADGAPGGVDEAADLSSKTINQNEPQ